MGAEIRRWTFAATVVAFVLSLALHSLIEDWSSLAVGGAALLSRSGLHVYADHPGVQVGPLGLAVIGALHVAWLGKLATAALLVPALHLTLRDAPRRFALVACGVMSLSWTWLTISGHLEDAISVVALLAAVRSSSRWRAAGWVVLAAAAKPWAACALPLLLSWGSLPVLVGGLGVAAVYLPFLAQPGAMKAGRATFLAEPASLVGVLFQHVAHQQVLLPSGYRLAQLVLVAGVVTVLACRKMTWALVAGLVGTRVLLDPGTWHYYYPPLAAGLLLVDLHRGHRLPWLTTIVALLALTSNTESRALGALRLVVLLVVAIVAVLDQRRMRGDARAGQRRAVEGGLVDDAPEVLASA